MIESVSRRAFSSTSGTYNVRASELARERKLNIFNVTVFLLDDTQHTFQVEKKAKGSILLEQVFQNIELVEKDYFGLQYTETGSPPSTSNTEVTRWLDPNKSVKKQLGANPQFWLAVRFYPPEPSRLNEEFTRYLLCLQLRKLLLDGRIVAPKNTAILLASFTVQAELGDYIESELSPNYLSELRLIPKQTLEDERKIRELHKLHSGQSPADAEANFLEHAKRLDCYGVEGHPAKDCNGKDILIGVTSIGIVVFQNNIRINTFSWGKIVKISFNKKQFSIQLKREPSESYDTLLVFNMRSGRASKALWRCSVERHGFFRLRAPRRRALLGLLATLAPRPAPAPAPRRCASSNRTFVRRSSSRNRERSPGKLSLGAPVTNVSVCPSRGHSRVTSHEELPPRQAWADEPEPGPSDDEGLFLERALRVPLSYVDESESDSEKEEVEETQRADDTHTPQDTQTVEESGIVEVRLVAGADGRFGFNVRGGRGGRGGRGRGAPVLVSRVAPHTPADRARPHIHEGDQVISINSVQVEDLSHEQVVQLIRNTRGVLTLVLKPNAVYEASEASEQAEEAEEAEPAACFVPLAPERAQPAAGSALQQSLLLLGDGLGGAALGRYEGLQRKLAEPAAAARLPHNHPKNRYRDIAPYDSTRVILKNCPSGDYINASYINMEIPSSDAVLTYIAAQGPLQSTVGDFWQMVWESESRLVVMLTVLVERGRAKCHQYWPKVGSSPLKATNVLSVQTNSEQNCGHYTRREMTLKENGGSSRTVTQLQYTAWPDHGVPDDQIAFIQFTKLCHKLRNPLPVIPTVVEEISGEQQQVLAPPMIVHCSAGVGRTGALILAETALTLINTDQPVYPLDLVKHMRTQRPMCIQNVTQYKFVCESILAAYTQSMTKLEDPSD